MKILLVHNDKYYPWATTRRAQALKREWVKDKVDIVHFNDILDGKDYDVIHFLYSGGISKTIVTIQEIIVDCLSFVWLIVSPPCN